MKTFLIALLLCLPVFATSVISFDNREDGGTEINAHTGSNGSSFDSTLSYTVSTGGAARDGYLAVSYGASTVFGTVNFSIGNFACTTDSVGPYASYADCNSDPRALLIPFTLGTTFNVSMYSTAYPVFFGTFATGWFAAELFENADRGGDSIAGDPVGISLLSLNSTTYGRVPLSDGGEADNSTAPEPASMALIGLGMLGVAVTRRRKV